MMIPPESQFEVSSKQGGSKSVITSPLPNADLTIHIKNFDQHHVDLAGNVLSTTTQLNPPPYKIIITIHKINHKIYSH